MKNRNRKPNRLRNYDYSQAGYYFVTICTQNKQLLFGKIIDRQMVTNDAGRMVERTWNELPKFYRGIQIDQFQIMPNHLHGIIIIVGTVGTGPVGTGPVGTGPRWDRPRWDRPPCLSQAQAGNGNRNGTTTGGCPNGGPGDSPGDDPGKGPEDGPGDRPSDGPGDRPSDRPDGVTIGRPGTVIIGHHTSVQIIYNPQIYGRRQK